MRNIGGMVQSPKFFYRIIIQMARKKKTRKISDIMPIRKSDKKPEAPKLSGKKLTRYELDAKAREDKKKRKHKGLASGSRHSNAEQNKYNQVVEQKRSAYWQS